MTDLVDATPDLRTRISREVIGSGDAMIDRHPAFIARCAGVSDVPQPSVAQISAMRLQRKPR